MLYRIKQFIWAVESLYKSLDYKYIEKYLDADEIKLFSLLKKTDKHHCVRVSKDILNHIENLNHIPEVNDEISVDVEVDKDRILKLALLHDIGKIKKPLNVIEKSIIVIFDKITKGKIKKYDNIKSIDIYYNHPKIGSDILRQSSKYDDEFLEIVENHHIEKETSNKLLEIVQYYDNKN
ncbi:HD domain-containing protein [Clostridium intestinale]|jgi:putative nucleotidyltransferase with HDIG domain|uniref:HD domain-containing protein n=2 Tax=Clostridium intestinale TaxID=36845 RepID=U2PQL5_9CLOT|nr:HD domain-containing protein [Clostridium intestinale]ERK28730.1 hypothetical protein CINTURNW_4114 [Clostridium intestinale URNW]QLY80037.1 HD domain-containing protein [Clostridium intestinale]